MKRTIVLEDSDLVQIISQYFNLPFEEVTVQHRQTTVGCGMDEHYEDRISIVIEQNFPSISGWERCEDGKYCCPSCGAKETRMKRYCPECGERLEDLA